MSLTKGDPFYDIRDWMKANPLSKKELKKLSDIEIPAYPQMRGENHPMYGRKHTESAKRIMSLKKKGITGVPLSEEHKEKLRAKRPYAGVNIANGKAFDWVITQVATGKKFRIKNLNAFCRENDLSPGNLYKTLKGTIKQHKGYALKHDSL